MDIYLTSSIRIAIRGISLVVLIVAVTWSVRSFNYESLIAALSSISAVLVIFSAGKSNTYEVMFGFLRIAAFTLTAGILSLIIALAPWIIFFGTDAAVNFGLAGGAIGTTIGFIFGVRMSLRSAVSVQPDELIAAAALLTGAFTAFWLLQLLLPEFMIIERFSVAEFILMIPLMFLMSALFVVAYADVDVLDAEIRGAKKKNRERPTPSLKRTAEAF